MKSLWFRLTKRWRAHWAVTCEAPSYHAPVGGSTPIVGMTEADYLRLLIRTRSWL
jgi:hypothetical protein